MTDSVLKDFKVVFHILMKKCQSMASSMMKMAQKKKSHRSHASSNASTAGSNKNRGKSSRITPQENLHHHEDDNHTLLQSEIEMQSKRRIKKSPKPLDIDEVDVEMMAAEDGNSSSDELDEMLDATPLIENGSSAEQQYITEKLVTETIANFLRYLIVGFPGYVTTFHNISSFDRTMLTNHTLLPSV